jgi:curved DNA-binding protein CbpA
VAAPLVPEDDLYARLEVGTDASPEAIELAWRALLKRHHPDVAGDDAVALERAKRINIAHDWLADPSLRARYDRERHGRGVDAARVRTGVRYGRAPRAWPAPPSGARSPQRRRSARIDLTHGEPAERLARFLDRVSRLTTNELDRMAAAEPPPIAFLATIRRFLTPEAAASFAAAEAALATRVPRARWAEVGLREGLLGVAAELVLSGFLDDTLAEPFRGRARDRLLRAWEASVDQPRYGPNGDEVVRTRDRAATLAPSEVAALIRASTGVPGDDRPWPSSLDRDEDEALRISAVLGARDVAAALRPDGLSPASAARARRLLARHGHVVALRHAFPPATYRALVGPFAVATGAPAGGTQHQEGPGIRRSS